MAKTFRSRSGHVWAVNYDLPAVAEVRDSLSVDLLTRDGLNRACGSMIDFARVLFVTCKKQASSLNLDQADFMRELEGSHESAVDAWLEAIADFFRRAGKPALARLAQTVIEISRAEEQMADELFSDETATRLKRGGIAKERSQRRATLDRLLREADDAAAVGESAPSTPGPSSPSSPRSPASTLSPNA